MGMRADEPVRAELVLEQYNFDPAVCRFAHAVVGDNRRLGLAAAGTRLSADPVPILICAFGADRNGTKP